MTALANRVATHQRVASGGNRPICFAICSDTTMPLDDRTVVNVSTKLLRHRPGSECWRKRSVRSISVALPPRVVFFTWKKSQIVSKVRCTAWAPVKEEVHPRDNMLHGRCPDVWVASTANPDVSIGKFASTRAERIGIPDLNSPRSLIGSIS